MKKITLHKYSVLFASLFALTASLAQAASGPIQIRVNKALTHGTFHVGTGSEISLDYPGQNALHDGIFLGKLIPPDGRNESFMLLDETEKTVFYAGKSSVSIGERDLEKVLKLYEQKGGTCTAYAIFDFLQQTNLSGFRGTGELAKSLSTEQERTQLLADAINQYYLVLQHQFSIRGILDGYGKKFGFKCTNKSFDAAPKARDYVLSKLRTGMPVLVSFNTGPDMVKPKFKLANYDQPKQKVDSRLWIPRRTGERESGGHSVVAVAPFSWNGHTQLVMLDSDWDAPRVWDLDEYVGPRTAVKEMEFITCQ